MSRLRAPTPSTSRVLQMEVKKKAKNMTEFIKELIGENITIVARNGIIYEGTLIDKDHGFLILKDAVVRGSKYIAKVGFLLVKPEVVQHIHSKPIELTENKLRQQL